MNFEISVLKHRQTEPKACFDLIFFVFLQIVIGVLKFEVVEQKTYGLGNTSNRVIMKNHWSGWAGFHA